MLSLANSKHLWRVWRASVRASVIREMEFRANFFIGIIRQIAWFSVFVFLIEVIFQHTSSIAGWNKGEVLTVLALSRLIEGLMRMIFTDNILKIPEAIRQGKIDFILLKPLPAQWYAAFERVTIYELGNIIAGCALLAYALTLQSVSLNVGTFIVFTILVAAGVTIFYSLLIGLCSLGFILERFESFYAFIVILTEPFTVPFDVFPRAPRIAITYLLPLAFVIFVPAQALTGRLHWWQMPLAIGLAAIFLFLSNVAWRAGLRRYSSASS